MGWIKNIIIGLLSIVIGSTAIFIVMNNSDGESLLAMNITDNDAQFYVKINNSFVLSGREYSDLFNYFVTNTSYFDENGTEINETFYLPNILNSTNNITYVEGDSNFTVIRTQQYENATVIDTYFYDASNEDIALFPIYHKIEILNGTGLHYRYSATDLDYSGPTIYELNHLVMVGKQMSIEWLNEYPYYQELNYEGNLFLYFNVTSDYQVHYIRLFDPITSLTITEPVSNRSYLGYRNPIVATFTNTTTIDKCWYTVDGGITNNTLDSFECGIRVNFTRLWSENSKFNITIYVNQTDGSVNSTTREINIKSSYLWASALPASTIYEIEYVYPSMIWGGSSGTTYKLFSYNITSKVLTDKSSKVSMSGLVFYSILNNRDLLYLVGSGSSFYIYNITSDTAINLTPNATTFFGTGSLLGATYDNTSNLLWFFKGETNLKTKILTYYNFSDNTFYEMSQTINTSINSSNTYVYSALYDYERDVIWIGSGGNPSLGYYNKSSGLYVNKSSCLQSLDANRYSDKIAIDYVNDIIYVKYYNNKIVKYYINNDSCYNLLASPYFDTTTTTTTGSISYINNQVFFIQNNVLQLASVNTTDDKGYLYGYSDLSNFLTTSLKLNSRIVYDNITDTYFAGTSANGLMSIGTPYSNIPNTVIDYLNFNNTYSNSIDPLQVIINETSPISDCWYSINGVINKSFSNFGCNQTYAINNYLYKFPIEIGVKYNFTFTTNNTYGNITTIYYENITIRNAIDFKQSIAINWFPNYWYDIFVDSYGNVFYFGPSGVVALYKYKEKEFIDLSQTDIKNTLQNIQTLGYAQDMIKNVTYFGSRFGSIQYYNYTDGLIYNLTAYSSGPDPINCLTIDKNYPEMLYAAGTSGKIFRVNTTSLLIEDLSTTDTSNWFSTAVFNSIHWVNISGKSYIYVGLLASSPNNFGYYNVSSNVSTKIDLSGAINSIQNMNFDNNRNLLFIIGNTGKFGYYNLSSQSYIDLSSTDINNFLGSTTLYAIATSGDEVLLSGGSDYKLAMYKFSTNTTVAINPTTVRFSNSIYRIAYSPIEDKFYFGGLSSNERLYYLENTTLNTNPFLVLPQINNSYYSLNAPIYFIIGGKSVDKCWYSINGGSNTFFNCTNLNTITINIPRVIGVNNLTMYVNDSSGNTYSTYKSFKSTNYTVITTNIGTVPSGGLADPSNDSIYVFLNSNGIFYRYVSSTNTLYDLRATDTENWIGSSSVRAGCKGSDGMIYLGIAGGKFGYYNVSSNITTNLTNYITPYLGTTALDGIDCSSNGLVYLANSTGGIISFNITNKSVTPIANINRASTTFFGLSLIENLNLLGFTFNYNSSGELYGYVNLTNNSLTFLYTTAPFKMTKSSTGFFYEILDNDVDTFYYGGSSSLLKYNVTSNNFTELILNNTFVGTVSYDKPISAMSLNSNKDRIYFATSNGFLSFINLSSNKIYSLILPYHPTETLAYGTILLDIVMNGKVYSGSNSNAFVYINENELIEDYDIIIPDNSCTYSGSGTWYIQISDNCVIGTQTIDSPCNVNGSNGILLVNGTVLCKNISYTPTAFNGNFTVGILTGKTFGAYK